MVEVNGPRPDIAASAVHEIWQRAQDVSRTLDRVRQDPALSAIVDPAWIAVAGHTLGGTAALALGGGGFDADAFVSACATKTEDPDCGWFRARGVSLAEVDRGMLERAHRDPGIGTVIAIDPEYADVFRAPSLTEQATKIRVIWLGAPEHPQVAEAGVPQAVIGTATIYDAFPVCTPKGTFILAEDGADATLCDTEAAARARIHGGIAKRLRTALDR
ncbi:hypothetical protein [Ponticoccus alexandrii]|uniref:Uncharacterized protein n=1 Tax=Ponticoccus alexandrii TaxID=1943633 RepID=A0ABX7F777_9RHOB|nr:hypothetical protein [Ponticoccus alexandrii]ETA49204.1 hypothetical protein P279_26060 [Rhodobacteraceae bacterium PD-2]QRF66319.1 hypothetical protein GQA70_08360 [Ponticoccus alexandrii]